MQHLKAFFYVLPAENGGYQHNLIGLAQGFRDLNVEYGASANYWRALDGTWLFRSNTGLQPQNADIVLISEQYLTYGGGELPEGFFELPGTKVLVHTGDGLSHQYNLGKMQDWYARFDLVLAHLYDDIQYPAHFRAWAFGITKHMEELALPDLKKENRICVNYRNSHSVRRMAQERIFAQLPAGMVDETREMDDWKQWENSADNSKYTVFQSAGRHSRKYNERIGGSVATACFGGVFFIRPWMWNWPAFKIANYFVQSAASVGRMQQIATRLGLASEHTYRIYQWDSWRFWEAFANESLAIHVDLKRYRIRLPEQPVAGRHYLGVDLEHPGKTIEILDDYDEMREIAAAGRKWALENYSATAQAKRLFGYLKEL